MTKKEATTPPPLLFMFQQLMVDSGLFIDSNDWRDLRTHSHVKWLQPLIDNGAIRKIGENPAFSNGPPAGSNQFNYHKFSVTPQGLDWWAAERTSEWEKEHGPLDVGMLSQPTAHGGPAIEGKGIGGEIRSYDRGKKTAALIKGIRGGLFRFKAYHFYPRGGEEWLTVELTEKGMRYFDTLPKLLLECA